MTFTSLTDFGPKPARFDMAFQSFNTSPSPLSLATTDKTLNVTITSRAPSPSATGGAGTSCVTVTDVRTGQTGPATLQSVSGVNSTWTWSTLLTQATNDGSYNLKYRVQRCDTGAPLTAEKFVTYVVDSSAPSVDVLLPGDGTTTAYTQQPLLAKFDDTGAAGISSSSIQFTLTDETTGTTTTYGVGSISYNSTTKWAKTAPLTLVPGHDYTATVRVRDNALNTTTHSHTAPSAGGGFRVTTVDVEPTYASIPDTACTLGPVDVATATRTATCNDVPLHLESTIATLGEARSAGWGAIVHQVSVLNAQMITSAGGVDLVGQPAWANETEAPDVPKILQPFRVDASPTSQSVRAGQLNVNAGTLTAKVPAAWQNARIEMVTADTIASPAPCADPAAVSEACSPSPIAIDVKGGWDPIAIEDHVAPCDAVVTHKQPTVIAPNATKNVTFTIDRSTFVPDEVRFVYRVNGTTYETSVPATAATTYTFQLPAVAEGTIVNYVAEVFGTFSSTTCADYASAVAPSNHSYTTIATADATKANDDLRALLSTFDYIAGTQPALVKPGATVPGNATICAFFAAPTPCDLMAPSNVASETTLRDADGPPIPVDVGGGGGGGMSAAVGCNGLVLDNDDWQYFETWEFQDSSDTQWGEYEYRKQVDPVFNALHQWGKAEIPTALDGDAHLWADGFTGFTFGITNPWTHQRDADRYDITIRYEVLGESHAYAEARAGTIFGFIIPFTPDNDAEGKVSGYSEAYLYEWQYFAAQGFGRTPLKGARAGTELVQWSTTNGENHQRVMTFGAYITEDEFYTVAAHLRFDLNVSVGIGAFGTAEASANFESKGWLHVFDVTLHSSDGSECF